MSAVIPSRLAPGHDRCDEKKINPRQRARGERICKKGGRLNRKIYCASRAINRLMRRTRDRIGRGEMLSLKLPSASRSLDNNSPAPRKPRLVTRP